MWRLEKCFTNCWLPCQRHLVRVTLHAWLTSRHKTALYTMYVHFDRGTGTLCHAVVFELTYMYNLRMIIKNKCYFLWYYIANIYFCNTTYHNVRKGNHWQYVDKRTNRWTSSIQSFTFILILPISMHCFGHLMHTGICLCVFLRPVYFSDALLPIFNVLLRFSQVQTIPFYGDIQLSLYMGIFLKIATLQPMEKVQILPFLCKRAKPQRVTWCKLSFGKWKVR